MIETLKKTNPNKKWSKPCKPSLLAPSPPLPGCTPTTWNIELKSENMEGSIFSQVKRGSSSKCHLNEPRNLGSKATLGTASAWGYQLAITHSSSRKYVEASEQESSNKRRKKNLDSH